MIDEAQFLEELKKDFFNEAHVLIEGLESNILILENTPDNKEAIDEVFRVAHTIKGGSATLDLDRIARFTHEMENLLDEVRSGNIKLTPNIIDTLLKSIDIIKNLIISSEEGKESPAGLEDEIIQAIKNATKSEPVAVSTKNSESPVQKATSSFTDFKKTLDLTLNEYERYLIVKAASEGFSTYDVYVKFNKENPMRTVSGIQIHSLLKEVTEILKSIPDIDDLMDDQFYDEMIFIVQSSLSPEDIYKKIYLSDVTDQIEIAEFTEQIEDDEIEETQIDQTLSLSNDDLQLIQDSLHKGKKAFKVLVTFDDLNPMRSVSGVLFYTMLRAKGDVINSSPTYDEFKLDHFYPKGEFVITTTLDAKELRSKLFLSDVTKELKFQEFQKEGETTLKPPTQEQVKPPDSTVDTPVQTTKPATSNAEKEPVKTNSSKNKIPQGTTNVPEKKHMTSVLRVESSRIDDMLNLVGELVIIKAGFMQVNEQNVLILDEMSNVFNQQKGFISELGEEMEEFFDKHLSNGKTSTTTIKKKHIDLNDSKEYFMEKLNALATYFDSFLPEYKTLQDKLKSSSQSLTRITDDLQESVMKVRMVPISQIFSRFPRLVRDISRNLKKNIDLVMQGEETELDKSVIEDLVDPLVHIVRNAVDHGIEPTEERTKVGKNPVGTVLLKANHEGNTILITVKDDGRGLSLDKIRKKAIQNNLIEPSHELSDKEITDLIFNPGFSTADSVTSLSGRGVGMDVVKRKIENLGGSVVIDSKEGYGSTFQIKIPLTLAIIQALLVKVSDYIYSIPINSVIETLRIGPEDVEILENTEVIRLREEILSLVKIDQLFKHTNDKNEDDHFYVIVVGTGDKKIGLGVHSLVGEQDIVIKPLNNKYTNVKGIAGATILGDGQVSLVLDVTSLFVLIADQKKRLDIRTTQSVTNTSS